MEPSIRDRPAHVIRRIALLVPDETAQVREYFRPYLTPGMDYRWNDAELVVNPERGEFDAVVATQNVLPLSRTYRLVCPPNRTLMAVLEPPDVLAMPDSYTRQFHAVVSQDPRIQCRRRFYSYSGHQWFVEVPYKDALHSPITEKPKLLSAIVSAKTHTNGHRRRLRFMQVLKEHFGYRLDWFGRGVNEIGSRKLDGMEGYRYHIVLENGQWPHYWTEKLADAYVANCVPIYWGASNIGEYFNPASLVQIDIDRAARAIDQIEEAIRTDLWTRAQPLLATARAQVVLQYHQFATWLRLLETLPVGTKQEVVIRPHTDFAFTIPGRLRLRLWRWRHRRVLEAS